MKDIIDQLINQPRGMEKMPGDGLRMKKRGLYWRHVKGQLSCESGYVETKSGPGMGYYPKDAGEFHRLNAEMPLSRRFYLTDCECDSCRAVRERDE